MWILFVCLFAFHFQHFSIFVYSAYEVNKVHIRPYNNAQCSPTVVNVNFCSYRYIEL